MKTSLYSRVLKTIVYLSLSSAIIMSGISLFAQTEEANKRQNVLFIAVDDLRPELGCYEKKVIKSPNIDQLARSGTVFTQAFCSVSVCGPSRASLFSGIYPARNRFRRWDCSQDRDIPGVVGMPMCFRNNNYKTISLGKVYHLFGDAQGSWDKEWRPEPVNPSGVWDYHNHGFSRFYLTVLGSFSVLHRVV